jgi:hypothetical protein
MNDDPLERDRQASITLEDTVLEKVAND